VSLILTLSQSMVATTSQSGSSLGSVEAHSLTLSHTLESMKCDSQASFLASPCLGLVLGLRQY